jgi:hypothetical protein
LGYHAVWNTWPVSSLIDFAEKEFRRKETSCVCPSVTQVLVALPDIKVNSSSLKNWKLRYIFGKYFGYLWRNTLKRSVKPYVGLPPALSHQIIFIVYAFRMGLRICSYCVLEQHYPVHLCNGYVIFFAVRTKILFRRPSASKVNSKRKN